MALETSTFGTDACPSDSMSGELASEHTYYLFVFDPSSPDTLAGYGGRARTAGSGHGDIQTLAVS